MRGTCGGEDSVADHQATQTKTELNWTRKRGSTKKVVIPVIGMAQASRWVSGVWGPGAHGPRLHFPQARIPPLRPDPPGAVLTGTDTNIFARLRPCLCRAEAPGGAVLLPPARRGHRSQGMGAEC